MFGWHIPVLAHGSIAQRYPVAQSAWSTHVAPWKPGRHVPGVVAVPEQRLLMHSVGALHTAPAGDNGGVVGGFTHVPDALHCPVAQSEGALQAPPFGLTAHWFW